MFHTVSTQAVFARVLSLVAGVTAAIVSVAVAQPSIDITSGAVQSFYRDKVPHIDRLGQLRESYDSASSFLVKALYGATWDAYPVLASAGFNTAATCNGFEPLRDLHESDGVKSILWTSCDVPYTPVTGNVNGDGKDELGLYFNSYFYIDSSGDGIVDYISSLGQTGDIPLLGDWDGDGKATPGVYRSGNYNPGDHTFYLMNSPGGPVTIEAALGNPGDCPLVGDWDGDRVDGVALYRPSTRQFFLYNQLQDPPAISVTIGDPGDLPVSGDWDGDGKCGVGVYRPSSRTFWLYDDPQSQPVQQVTCGNPGDTPLTGKWGDSQHTGIGVYRSTIHVPDSESRAFFLDLDRDGSSDIIRDFGNPRFERYRNDSRVICWQFADEPLGNALADTSDPSLDSILDDFRGTYEMYSQRTQQQLMFPEVPLTQDNSEWWYQFINAMSLGCHDNYPKFLDRPFTSIGDLAFTVSAQTRSLNGAKPSWFVAQTFYSNPDSGDFRWAMPTFREARAMVYTALVHGATGIVYFTWDSWISRVGCVVGIAPNPPQVYPEGFTIAPPAVLDESRELWNGIAEINRQLDTLAGVILSRTDTLGYSVFVDDTLHQPVPVRCLLKTGKESRYLIVVNISSSPLNARFQFSDSIPALVGVKFESGRSLACSENAFTDHFDGFGVHVYVIPKSSEPTSVDDGDFLPYQFELSQNYPNPFNPVTTIEYSVPSRTDVTIEIFNVLGQSVRTLVNDTKSAGSYRIEWNGNDDTGIAVSTGVYLYRFQAGEVVQTKKMLLIK